MFKYRRLLTEDQDEFKILKMLFRYGTNNHQDSNRVYMTFTQIAKVLKNTTHIVKELLEKSLVANLKKTKADFVFKKQIQTSNNLLKKLSETKTP